ncbi:MAG: Xaa-Pro aminopeptidase [Tatlockia sp.]|nr:Xaa-Pro aminopeptidase [Tatlockia sp.]
MICQQEYQTRRQKLAASLPSGSIAIIPAANECLRNGDAHYRFRQDSDFYYLTGFNEPEAILLLVNGSPSSSYLFNRSNDPEQEQWTGKRLGQEGARQILGFDEAYPIESFSSSLPDLMIDKSHVFFAIGRHPAIEKEIAQAFEAVKKQIRRGIKIPEAFCDLEPNLSEMRLFKSEAEIELMRRAAEISVNAHKAVMQACSKVDNEYKLEAELLYQLNLGGCRAVAYEPIVGGGENSCILHYTDNNQPLKKGELLLVDAGGEYGNYAADITRTFPINGRFSEEQRAIYELVLQAQQAGIACIKPGLAWNEIQEKIVQVLTAGLCDLGLLNGSLDELIAAQSYKPFYMHSSGHWLGLDVHDAGRYKINGQWRALEPGMVLTVEPGIYISAGMDGVDPRWWNIGVRIEDDILVTQEGHENLTASLPVEIAEIEALLRG